jgi:hypothetical protein
LLAKSSCASAAKGRALLNIVLTTATPVWAGLLDLLPTRETVIHSEHGRARVPAVGATVLLG